MTKPAASGLCYKCKYRKDLTWSAHSECTYPESKDVSPIVAMQYFVIGLLGNCLQGNRHGIEKGWFMWPVNFDPAWLEKCEFYEGKENTDAEHPSGDGTVQQGMV